MLAAHFITYSEKCNPDAGLLTSSSIIGSKWIRRYLRLVLTEPGATIAVTVEQRTSAVLALAVLLPGALPQSYMNTFPSDQRAGADALRSLHSAVWELEAACTQLFKAIVGAMNKFIAATHAKSRPLPNNAVKRDVVTSLSAWLVARPAHAGPAAAGGPPVAAVAAAAAGAAAAGAVAAAVEAAAVAAAAGAAAAAVNGVSAGVGGEPAPNLAAAAAAAAAAEGGRRPAPTSAFDVLFPGVRALGRTAAHDVVSFCIAVATDPVMSAFHLDHVAGLRGLADLLRSARMEADMPVVLTGAVKVRPIMWERHAQRRCKPCCCKKQKFKKRGIDCGSNPRLPDATRRSRLMRVGGLLPTRLPMRLPRGLVTAGAFDICTRAILSEIFAISHFLFLRF